MTKRLTLFLIAVVIQCMILAAVPGRQVYTRLTGTPILIRTIPVDPYDFLSGYYVTLSYEISRPWKDANSQRHGNGRTQYVLLERNQENHWSAMSVHAEHPGQIATDNILIKGRYHYNRILYGIEAFYIPEEKRQEIEQALRKNNGRATAQIKVDRFGHAALESLIINGMIYKY